MVKWKPEFTCYNDDIDNQHKKLFELLSELQSILNLNDDYDHYDEIISVFKELSEYTVYHFNFEEELFNKYHYDPISKMVHLKQHKEFIDKVSAIDVNEVDKDQRGITMDLVLFVVDWIEKHILETDRKFGQFLVDAI